MQPVPSARRTPRLDFLQVLQSAADLAADDVARLRARYVEVAPRQRRLTRGPNGGYHTPIAAAYAAAVAAHTHAQVRLVRALDLLGAQPPSRRDWRACSLDQAVFVARFGETTLAVEPTLARLSEAEAAAVQTPIREAA